MPIFVIFMRFSRCLYQNVSLKYLRNYRLITQNIEDIPFDMKDYFHIVYKKDNIFNLKKDLKCRIEGMKNQKKYYFSVTPEIFINGVKLEEDTKECIGIEMTSQMGYIDNNYEKRGIKSYVGEMSLALYNPSEMYKIESIGKYRELNLQLILDKNMPFPIDSSSIFTISDNKRIQKILLDSISPNYWEGKKFPIEIDIKYIEKIKEIYCCQLFLFLDRKIEYKFKCCFKLIDS